MLKNFERVSGKLLTQLKSQKRLPRKSHKEDSELADRQQSNTKIHRDRALRQFCDQ